jgi:ATP-dependent helicase/nuclease subunit B
MVAMRVRFLLGPAGSGKTSLCLEEVRRELANPEGSPLLFMAPKQATFQLERQILADPSVPGYTRLQILSFERLATLLLENLGNRPVRLLEEEGRLMVLRALLMQRQADLRIFHATARLPGFARQLSLVLRECQRSRVGPAELADLGRRLDDGGPLSHKLADLSLLLDAYLRWLEARNLSDATRLTDLALEALAPGGLRLGGLWLDGFAEMTPQELDLLAAVIPFTDRATLGFCLDHVPAEDPSWLSTWSMIGQTYRRCWNRLAGLQGVELEVEVLSREGVTRFARSGPLHHLESQWASGRPALYVAHPDRGATAVEDSLRLVRCTGPEAEAMMAAREVLRHVRDNAGRFREVAVLVRSLEGYHAPLRRAFTRYGIPFFMDRREPVGHHPLAELTRSALRIAALGWQHEDVFSALKTGLSRLDEASVDWLENAALANGWQGTDWTTSLSARAEGWDAERAEGLRRRFVPAFAAFADQLRSAGEPGPTGAGMGSALRTLWDTLGVEAQVDRWIQEAEVRFGQGSSVHATVWEQILSWVRNLELAFEAHPMRVREWLPILEAGLGSLTVGVIPPALDQVLVGTVDRSRNPELKVTVVLGMNESVFPPAPTFPRILTEEERSRLAAEDFPISVALRRQVGHERYYGYIACTRASERLVLGWSVCGTEGDALNPSPFIARIRELFPGLRVEDFDGRIPWDQAGHPVELAGMLIRAHGAQLEPELDAGQSPDVGVVETLGSEEPFRNLLARYDSLRRSQATPPLSATTTQHLYGTQLRTSVSALEDYAACPFRFFVARGLEARERELHEPDDRHRGSFQHAILQEFHARATGGGGRWRDLDPLAAAHLAGTIGESLLETYRGGLFQASPAARFVGEHLVRNTRELLRTLVAWMRQYAFDPVAVELGFGFDAGGLPGWELDLGEGRSLLLRGRIDRVDLCPSGDGGRSWVNVIDYKSSEKRLKPLHLEHGLQLQLLSYLGVLRDLKEPGRFFGPGCMGLLPAGAFYVRLNPGSHSGADRAAAVAADQAGPGRFHRHMGRFNRDLLSLFDHRPGRTLGDQFQFRLTKEGRVNGSCKDPVSPQELQRLVSATARRLVLFGREIFEGHVEIQPYQIGVERACEWCDFKSVCRFDPWVDEFRILRKPKESPADANPAEAGGEA